jgi:hypothetical protein
MIHRRENFDSVSPASSEDVSAGELQARLAAMVDSIQDDIIGKRRRGSSPAGTRLPNASSAVPPAKWSGKACHGLFIYFSLLKPARAGNKIRPLKLIK